jgi:DNA ligase 1
MRYLELARVYEALEATSKRLEKTYIISEFLKKVGTDELSQIMLLLQGKIFPPWDDKKIGIASNIVIKAIRTATGLSEDAIKREWKKTGDLGLVVELIEKGRQQTLFQQELDVLKVFQNLQSLAATEGKGAIERKLKLISALLTSAQPLEARYIVRTLLEDLRVGVGEGSIRDAIVWAYFGEKLNISYDKNENELKITENEREEYNRVNEIVQEAYDLVNDFGKVAIITKTQGMEGLQNVSLIVGNPIKVMLGPKEKDAKAALERVKSPCQAEYKYDGFRIQVHKDRNTVKLFTRNLENVTSQFPDIVQYVKTHIKGDSFILDSEAVGYSAKTGKYTPFQEISQRIKRIYGIEQLKKELPVELNIFDCMYYNGKSMIKEPFQKRRALLEKIIREEPKKIVLSTVKVVKTEQDVKDFFEQSIKAGNEGLMLKKLDAPYKPGKRVGYMVKMKETEEPLDLVITEAEWGEGKRANWLSSFTLACVDEDGNFLEIGKVGTGIKEKLEMGVSFEELTELLKPLIKSQKGKIVQLKPKIVVEIAYEEIQKSPTYSSGYALRFPRVLRLRNMERSAEDATRLEYIQELYVEQKR